MNRTPIFGAVRAILGRGFTQSDVDAIDDAIDVAEASLPAGAKAQSAPRQGPAAVAGRRIGEPGLKLIQSFEGCARKRSDGLFEAYPDPGTGGHPWTIGWGTTGRDIRPGVILTQAECDARFRTDLQRYVDDVARAVANAPTTANQFDAMVSFHYNTGAIGRATLMKKHKAGDIAGAAREFARWNRAGGQVMRGLVRRRAAEAALYRSC